MGKHTITIRGAERNLWIDFVSVSKKNKKTAWEELKPLLKEHIKRNKGGK
tara:strand:- start:198 stop:347 length:150 start_codon:yes stop_codon:yes gene_type:complete